MLLPISLSLFTLLPLAHAGAHAYNVFTSPPAKGSGAATLTWVQGSTYTIDWITDWTNLTLYIQSASSHPDGSPLQSYTLYEGDGSEPTAPYSFLVGDNLKLSLSPFHFEIFSSTAKSGFVSDNVNIVGRSSSNTASSNPPSNTPSKASSSTANGATATGGNTATGMNGGTATATKTSTAQVTVTAEPGTTQTQTGMGDVGGAATDTTTAGAQVTLTQTTTVSPSASSSASTSASVSLTTSNSTAASVAAVNAVFGLAVGLGCVMLGQSMV